MKKLLIFTLVMAMASLAGAAEIAITVTVDAPTTVLTGEDFTVQVAAKSNITGTVVLVTVLVALVVGIAIASIKISRR